jgi:putative SOS response-associated peptidase YedK
MCGRNSLYVGGKKLEDRYEALLDTNWSKSYNISPGNSQPVVTKNSPKNLEIMKWSFIPGFVDSETDRLKWSNKSLINARIETVQEKGMFKKAFREKKCLIPSTGFYEWRDEGKPKKTPYHIKPENDRIFSFAGFYNDGTFIIITKESDNSDMAEIHDRTPVILDKDQEEKYLDGDLSREDLENVEASDLSIEQVSRKVNDPGYDSKDVLRLESRQSRLSDM